MSRAFSPSPTRRGGRGVRSPGASREEVPVTTTTSPSAPRHLTRRALLGRMLALPLLPALSPLAACTPGGWTDGQTSGAPSSGLRTLEVATVYAYLGYLPLYAAIQRGHLRERYLELEIREFKGGAANVLIGSYDHVLKLRDQGMD